MLASAGDGGICAFWRLSADDVVPASAGFGRDGPRPLPVLRLRRLHAGGTTQVQEITLQLRGPGGHGEQVFSVDARPARYDAEFGLSDASGGWVMLARANAIDHAARVDVRLEQRAHPAASLQVPTETHPSAGTQTAAPTLPAADPSRLSDAVSSISGEDMTAPEVPVPPEPARRAEHNGIRSPTAPMRYGQPTPGGAELLIEAELRINGCAAPGALIDLFGQPYRVGPGGRFQLVIRVDDPELIKRAFELNPPDLPDRPADA